MPPLTEDQIRMAWLTLDEAEPLAVNEKGQMVVVIPQDDLQSLLKHIEWQAKLIDGLQRLLYVERVNCPEEMT